MCPYKVNEGPPNEATKATCKHQNDFPVWTHGAGRAVFDAISTAGTPRSNISRSSSRVHSRALLSRESLVKVRVSSCVSTDCCTGSGVGPRAGPVGDVGWECHYCSILSGEWIIDGRYRAFGRRRPVVLNLPKRRDHATRVRNAEGRPRRCHRVYYIVSFRLPS